MSGLSSFAKPQGVSRHYPQLPDVIESMFDLMRAVELSRLNKQHLYKHFLKCADFAVNFLNSETYFYFCKRLDDNGELCVEKTLESTVYSHSFLARAQIVQCCSTFLQKAFRSNSEQLLVQTLLKAFDDISLGRVVMKEQPRKQPRHAVFFAVSQLDVTGTFCLLLVLGFPLHLTLEAFDEYENVSFADFTLKELVFNAQAAPDLVTFWFPAFSLDDKVVFQARFIETLQNFDNAGDDEEFEKQTTFALQQQLSKPIDRGVGMERTKQAASGFSEYHLRLIVAEEIATQIEPLKQQQKRLVDKISELENQNGILAASQQKLYLDFDKMVYTVKELSRSLNLLGGRERLAK